MRRFNTSFIYLFIIHLSALLVLFVCRIVFILVHLDQLGEASDSINLIGQALLRGFKFDNLIVSYVAALPTLLLFLAVYFNGSITKVIKFIAGYYILLASLVLAISVADIPYFTHHTSHINASIFGFVGFEGTADLMLEEKSFYPYWAMFFLLVVLFTWVVIRMSTWLIKHTQGRIGNKALRYTIPLTFLIWTIFFLGIRGSVQAQPLRVSESYFCANPFINQVALNPSFFLIKTSTSYFKEFCNISDMLDEEKAANDARRYLGIKNETDSTSFVRYVAAEGEPMTPNIVMILMESMSGAYLDYRTADGKPLTPYLNKLIEESYYFNNFFSSGIHTNNGVTSALYGFPPQFNKTTMGIEPNKYYGLPHMLKEIGYKTMFFLTHSPNYDNMAATIYNNGFEELHSQANYPSDKVVNLYGVQDDYLFDYSLDNLNKSSTPFFATILTISAHVPYVIPDEFKDFSDSDEECALAFADHSLRVFMEGAKKEEWYQNTIFVLLGDHGRGVGERNYEIPLSNNNVPLLFYSPLFEDVPKKFEQFSTQMDVFPTTMGLIHQPYKNNTLGIDLLKEERPYAYFVNDNAMGCIDEEFYYIYNVPAKQDFLYRYTSDAPVDNVIEQYKSVADSMKQYSASMMITSNYLIREKLAGEN